VLIEAGAGFAISLRLLEAQQPQMKVLYNRPLHEGNE
jgi:hypothetical protein